MARGVVAQVVRVRGRRRAGAAQATRAPWGLGRRARARRSSGAESHAWIDPTFAYPGPGAHLFASAAAGGAGGVV